MTVRRVEIIMEFENDDFLEWVTKHALSVRVLSNKEWPETGQSAYKVVRSTT